MRDSAGHTSAEWQLVEEGDQSLDVLDIIEDEPGTWRFVWPGRVVVQARSAGIGWAYLEQARELAVGQVVVADPFAAHIRIRSTRCASLRVIFERATDGAERTRVRPRGPCSGPVLPIDAGADALFREATPSRLSSRMK